jgi:hypothetical protein
MSGVAAYPGCTCAVCGTQWPDPPSVDGAPVFCDGVCAAEARAAVVPPRRRLPVPRRYVDDPAALAALHEEAERLAVARYLEANPLPDPPPPVDLTGFDRPWGSP